MLGPIPPVISKHSNQLHFILVVLATKSPEVTDPGASSRDLLQIQGPDLLSEGLLMESITTAKSAEERGPGGHHKHACCIQVCDAAYICL